MDTNDYPREWRAAAAILAGELLSEMLPQMPSLKNARYIVYIDASTAPPPPPPKPKPLPMYVQMSVCAMAWNDDLGMLVDIDD